MIAAASLMRRGAYSIPSKLRGLVGLIEPTDSLKSPPRLRIRRRRSRHAPHLTKDS
jgi:hypothetical protein